MVTLPCGSFKLGEKVGLCYASCVIQVPNFFCIKMERSGRRLLGGPRVMLFAE